MEWLVEKIGAALLALLTALMVAIAVHSLQRLVERRERWRAQRRLRGLLALTMGLLMAEGLPLIWPALTAWKPIVLGACIGLTFAATREWGVPRFPPVASEERP